MHFVPEEDFPIAFSSKPSNSIEIPGLIPEINTQETKKVEKKGESSKAHKGLKSMSVDSGEDARRRVKGPSWFGERENKRV